MEHVVLFTVVETGAHLAISVFIDPGPDVSCVGSQARFRILHFIALLAREAFVVSGEDVVDEANCVPVEAALLLDVGPFDGIAVDVGQLRSGGDAHRKAGYLLADDPSIHDLTMT